MQRQIPPLAQRMLESLENFINLDTPFRIEERQNRIDLVRASLAKPKVTASEQVRQVLEAYNIEAEYGRKIDSYEATVEGKVVNILVVGELECSIKLRTRLKQVFGITIHNHGKLLMVTEDLLETVLEWLRN
jgi:gamma-glutamylcysteine synthetase